MIITFIAIIKIYDDVNSHDALYHVTAIKCISKKIPRLLFILDFFHKFLSAAYVLFIFCKIQQLNVPVHLRLFPRYDIAL